MDFMALLGLILYQMAILFVSPIFWLIVLIIGWQIRRTAKMKSDFFHVPRERILRKTVFNVLLGLGGGFIGSILLVLVGVSIEEIGIEYLWIVAIVLIFIRQRWMCFAYAGGLIALSKYFLGWPAVNIPQLMGLVAVLHLVEALLIYTSGASKALPIYTMGRNQQLVGGFVMQSFWPLPLVALSAALVPMGMPGPGDMLAMPGWWPLLPMEYIGGRMIPQMTLIYSMLPVLAALGYSDLALTTTTRQKARLSSRQLLLYSLGLLALAILAARIPVLAILPALYAPLGHEFLIKWGQRHELKGTYLYVEPEQGVMVLDVLEGFAAERAGLKTGDILLKMNEMPLQKTADFFFRESQIKGQMTLEYQRLGQRCAAELQKGTESSLGIITVPEAKGLHYLDFSGGDGLALALLKRLKKKLSKHRRAKSGANP